MTESNKRAFADLNTMDRLAYDLGAEYGSDTLSDASYNADVDIIYCSLFCGTDNALKEYINKRAVEGGNCTRKILTRIDEDVMGEDAPQFRMQTAEEQALVKRTVDQLMNETYTEDDMLQPIKELDVQWMEGSVRKWCEEQRQRVLKTGSRALNCFYKRSSVSAWRLACMMFHLWMMDEDYLNSQPSALNQIKGKVIKFYRFMATYILEGLLDEWGKQYEQMHKTDDVEEGPKVTLYDQLPQRFSRDQLRELVVKLDLSCPVRTFIFKWKRAKLIYEDPDEKDVFVKNY